MADVEQQRRHAVGGADGGDDAVAAAAPPAPFGARLAGLVFAACLVAGGLLIVFHLGRYRWFFCDEWDFVASRQADVPGDLLRHHGGHWVTLPVLVFRLLWNVFHLHYIGYQAALVAVHVATIALLRLVMRRAGVGPWLATAAALGLLLFGGAEDNIVWAFQITLVGGLAFGIGQLLLLDHDGPLDRRDWLGVGAGALAVMCSGVGIVMALLAGAAALLRRGRAPALFHALPPLALYATWWLIERPTTAMPSVARSAWEHVVGLVQWNLTGVIGAFTAFGYFRAVGIALLLLLVAGLVLVWRGRGPRADWHRLVVPGVLLAGAFVFLTMTGATRGALGAGQAATSRYVYVVMALALPALAVAAQAVTARWRLTTLPVLLLLLAGIVPNARLFGTHFPWIPWYFQGQRRLVAALPRMPEAARVAADVQPEPLYATGLTIGWLGEQLRAGRLPEPDPAVDAGFAANLRVRLALAQSAAPQPPGCTPLSTPADITTRAGDVLWFRDRPLGVMLLDQGRGVAGSVVFFAPDIGGALTMQLDGLSLRIAPAPPNATLRLGPALDVPIFVCRQAAAPAARNR